MKWSFDEKQIATLILNDPPCNEIGLNFVDQLDDFLLAVKKQKPKAVLIQSDIPAGFSAGADLRQLYENIKEMTSSQKKKAIGEFINRIHRLFTNLDQLPCATIGVTHGVCFGGGFELALTCDLLIAEESTRFCFPELRLGLIPGFGGIPRLRRDLGNAVVRDIIMTGRSLNANKALTLGLVSQVVPDGKGKAVASRMAEQIVKFDSSVMMKAKRFSKPLLKKELDQEKKLFLELFQNRRVQDALHKFVNDQSAQPYLP